MSVTPEIPEKPFFRVNEVCQLTDTQPYVLRFWESEFPQLSPDRGHGGKPVYKHHEVELIFRIKQLLYEEEYTIAGARQVLSREGGASARKAGPSSKVAKIDEKKPNRPRQLKLEPSPQRPTAVPEEAGPPPMEGIPKERYDHAIEEITHLRLCLSEAETRARRADEERDDALADAEGLRDRHDRAIGRLEAILQRLDPGAP